MSLSKVAIIGTGMTALSIGYYLPLLNPLVEITFFDKAQKSGGRVATRRSRQNQELLFDHGAPFLWEDNVKGEFRKVLEELNAVKEIQVNFAKADYPTTNITSTKTKNVLIGNNGLDTIPQTILKSLKNVHSSHFDHRVTSIAANHQSDLTFTFQQTPNKISPNPTGPFNQVFCCIPFPQAKSIKQDIFSFEQYNKISLNQAYNANWIVLVSVKRGELFGEDTKGADVVDFTSANISPIKYAVKQTKKFDKLEKSETQNWVLYFSDSWTETHLQLTKDQVQEKFLQQVLPQLSNNQPTKPSFIAVHRWLYSSPKVSHEINAPLVSPDGRLIFAGDWVGNRQSVGECWALGKLIVEELCGGKGGCNKSKL